MYCKDVDIDFYLPLCMYDVSDVIKFMVQVYARFRRQDLLLPISIGYWREKINLNLDCSHIVICQVVYIYNVSICYMEST